MVTYLHVYETNKYADLLFCIDYKMNPSNECLTVITEFWNWECVKQESEKISKVTDKWKHL